MSFKDLRDELSDEVSKILAQDFSISVTTTRYVPSSNDGAITFPNLDTKTQACKLIETCVLYIDIRRPTELNLSHKPGTVAKLYSAFVRAMTRCARYHGGHVRGIIGDRIMVIFDSDDAYSKAVDTAILMNSTAKHVLNKHFKANEIECGIGIDAGKILSTKTGFRRKGIEQHNYKSLVWLGRPANVASKLTDLANKAGETVEIRKISAAYDYGTGWVWRDESPEEYLGKFVKDSFPPKLSPTDIFWQGHIFYTKSVTLRAPTPPILMTATVFNGYKKARPAEDSITKGWFKEISPIEVSGYGGKVFGGDVVKLAFKK